MACWLIKRQSKSLRVINGRGGEAGEDCDKEKIKGWWSNSLEIVALLHKPQIPSKKTHPTERKLDGRIIDLKWESEQSICYCCNSENWTESSARWRTSKAEWKVRYWSIQINNEIFLFSKHFLGKYCLFELYIRSCVSVSEANCCRTMKWTESIASLACKNAEFFPVNSTM